MHVAILLREHSLREQFGIVKYQQKIPQSSPEISKAKTGLCLISKSSQPFIAALG